VSELWAEGERGRCEAGDGIGEGGGGTKSDLEALLFPGPFSAGGIDVGVLHCVGNWLVSVLIIIGQKFYLSIITSS